MKSLKPSTRDVSVRQLSDVLNLLSPERPSLCKRTVSPKDRDRGGALWSSAPGNWGV